MRAFVLSVISILGAYSLLCSCSGCLSKNVQRFEETFEDGNRFIYHGYYKDGDVVEHGKYTALYADGIRCEINYRDGVADGKCIWYYPDGTVAMEGIYRRGRPWDGVLYELEIPWEDPHKYEAGKKLGVWKDPRGFLRARMTFLPVTRP